MFGCDVLSELTLELAAAETLSDLEGQIPAIAATFGFVGLGYYRLTRLGGAVSPIRVFGQDIEAFISAYVERGYSKVDPVIALTFRRDAPFSAREVEELFPEPADLHALRREHWARDGLFCPVSSSCGEVGVVGWQSHDPVTLSPAARLEIVGISNMLVSRSKAISENEARDLDIRPLSRREMECAYWLSQGKSSNEIADIIGISVHTVRQYLESSVAKLNAKNRSDMILRASALGLLAEHR